MRATPMGPGRIDPRAISTEIIRDMRGAYPIDFREERNAVCRAMQTLGFICCGVTPGNLEGVSDIIIRIKCRVCGRLHLRYRNIHHA